MTASAARIRKLIEIELLTEVERTREAFTRNGTEGTRRNFEGALERFRDFALDGKLTPAHASRLLSGARPAAKETPNRSEALRHEA